MKNMSVLVVSLVVILSFNGCITGRAINGDEIETAVLEKRSDFKDCYLKVAPKEPSGTFRIHFVILPEGNVSSAELQDDSLKVPAVSDCVIEILKKIEFPQSAKNGRIEVVYPFKFHAHDSVEPEGETSPTIQNIHPKPEGSE